MSGRARQRWSPVHGLEGGGHVCRGTGRPLLLEGLYRDIASLITSSHRKVGFFLVSASWSRSGQLSLAES